MPTLPVVKAKDLIDALARAGFYQQRQKGSHVRLKHSDGRVTSIPVHSGREIGRGLLRKILRDVEWSVEDLTRFLEE